MSASHPAADSLPKVSPRRQLQSEKSKQMIIDFFAKTTPPNQTNKHSIEYKGIRKSTLYLLVIGRV